ncbi:hypothetical protein ON058_06735 [Demequina sp. B12]|uniref:alpha/beta hydrolase n=1 Tax=Demequina sp. B12 TaxID=2992757 RepID=UPI00237B303E|nr:alpha/beta fold hydrolase [Demequina sp. B12]MDE0573106.1 hypothetical protein [Demequina sp. B12]
MDIPVGVFSSQFENTDSALPTVLLLHGYGSHEHDLTGLSSWLPRHLRWASPRAPLPLGQGGAAWFPLTLPDEPAQAPVDDATKALWAWIDDVAGDGPIIPVGFSQGGLMATELLRTRPERVPGAVVLAGFITAEGESDDPSLADRQTPVFWGRGDADPVIWPAAVERTQRWLATHSALQERSYRGLGHSVSEQEMDDVAAFLRDLLH